MIWSHAKTMFDNYVVNSMNGGLFDVYVVSIDLDQIALDKNKSKTKNPHTLNRNSANRRSSSSRTNNNKSGCLKVTLNMCAKIADPIAYFSNPENMDVKIGIIQTIDADIRKKITSDPLQYMQTTSKEIKSKFVRTQIVSLFDSLDFGISNALKSAANPDYAANNKIKNSVDDRPKIPYTKKMDANGAEYYEIPIKAEFVVDETEGGASVRDLGYFFYSFIDPEQKYLDRSKEQKSIIQSFSLNQFIKSKSIGNIRSELVIKNGKIETKSNIFVDNSGKVWVGPVHKMPNGKFMKGNTHSNNSPDSDYLQHYEIENLKIRDNRILKAILERRLEATIGDIENANAVRLGQQNIPVFSDIYLSRDKTGCVRYMFSFNVEEAVKQSTTYPNFITSLKKINPAVYSKIMESAIVEDLVISRKRIADNGDISTLKGLRSSNSDMRSLDGLNNKFKDVVVQAGARKSSDLQTLTTTIVPQRENGLDTEAKISGNIRELTNIKSRNSLEIKHYSGVDLDIASLGVGTYQYSVDLTLKEPIGNILSTFITNLENILGDVGTSSSANINIINYLREIETRPYYYDSYLGRFKPEFIKYYNSRYVSGGKNSFILEAIRNYVSILFTFVDSKKFPYSPTEVTNYLCLICSPNTGSPEGISLFSKLLVSLIAQIRTISSVQSYTNRESNRINPAANVAKGREQKANKFSKNFSNLYTSSDPSGVGFDYLFLSSTDLELNKDSLTKITKSQLKNRFDAEVNKFFKQGITKENILISNQNGDVLNPNDKLENTKYTYLSPSNIFMADGAFANTSCQLSSQDATMLNKVLSGIIAYNNSKQTDRFAPFQTSISPKSSSGQQQLLTDEKIAQLLMNAVSEGKTQEEIKRLKEQLVAEFTKQQNLSPAGDEPDNSVENKSSGYAYQTAGTQGVSPPSKDRDRLFEMISNADNGGMLDECNNIDGFLFNDRSGTGAVRYVDKLVLTVCGNASNASTPPINSAPIHLKALLLAVNGSNFVKSNPVFTNNGLGTERSVEVSQVLKNPDTYGFFQMNYKLLKQISVFRGYNTEGVRTFVGNPIWTPMTVNDLENLNSGNLICKLADITDVGGCIDSNNKLKLPPYNDIFIVSAGDDKNKAGIGGKYLLDGPFDFASSLYGGKFADDMNGISNLLDQKRIFTDNMSCGEGENPINSEAAFGPVLGIIPINIGIDLPSQSENVDTNGMSTKQVFDTITKMGLMDILPDKIRNNTNYKTPSMQYSNTVQKAMTNGNKNTLY